MNSDEANDVLSSGRYDEYISYLVQKEFPRWLFPQDEVPSEIDELIQHTRIKLWDALQKRSIENVKAYIASIVRNGIIDVIRRHRRHISLSLDEYGELCRGTLLVQPGEGMRDPAYEFEQREKTIECTTRLVMAILSLPRAQRFAMICALKELLDDVRLLGQVLNSYNLDINAFAWPDDPRRRHTLQVSLSYARKKLRVLLKRMFEQDR
jgi:RNA polymerase sigma factor (sigma-70 family)